MKNNLCRSVSSGTLKGSPGSKVPAALSVSYFPIFTSPSQTPSPTQIPQEFVRLLQGSEFPPLPRGSSETQLQ